VRNLGEGTLRGYRQYVERFLRALGGDDASGTLRRLSADRLQHFVFDYGQHHGPGARCSMQKSLRSFLSFCHSRGYTAGDLGAAVPIFRRRALASIPRGLDGSSSLALLGSLEGRGRAGLRDAAMVCLLSTYGVRGLPLRRLQLCDLDWGGSRIRFPAVKGGLLIEQPLTAEAGNRLLAYLKQARPAGDCTEVFLSARPPYGPLRAASSLSSVIARRLRQAGIRLPEGVSRGTHAFRHAFASRLIGRVPIKHLADMLGHRDPASSMIYGKLDFAALQQAALPWPEEQPR
jgi:integrase